MNENERVSCSERKSLSQNHHIRYHRNVVRKLSHIVSNKRDIPDEFEEEFADSSDLSQIRFQYSVTG